MLGRRIIIPEQLTHKVIKHTYKKSIQETRSKMLARRLKRLIKRLNN